MVEQIDRDAAADYGEHRLFSSLVANSIRDGRDDDNDLVQANAVHRQAAEARMIARMREPDAKMVEAVAEKLADWFEANTGFHKRGDPDIVEACYGGSWLSIRVDRLATAALAAAADAMEVGDAG